MGKWILIGAIMLRKVLFYGSIKSDGVILQEVVDISGSSATLVAWAFSMQSCLAFSLSPLALVLTNHFGARNTGIVGGIMSGLGYIYAAYFLSSAGHLFVGMIISGIGFNLVTVPPHIALQHYSDGSELQLIMTILSLFDFAGIAVGPPVVQYLHKHYGLENSMVLLGALIWNCVVTGIVSKCPKNSKYEKFARKNTGGDTPDLITLFWSSLDHPNVFVVIIIASISTYVYVSWALFLVSLGRSLGLDQQSSVFLSTASGIGGLFGKLFVIMLVTSGKFNAVTSALIPCIVTASVFSLVWLLSNFYLILVLMFVSGFSLSVLTSNYSVMPTITCPSHYRFLVIFEYIGIGVCGLMGGLVSGAIQDLTGSTIFVYLFNAAVCISMVPLAVWWACHDTILDCRLQIGAGYQSDEDTDYE